MQNYFRGIVIISKVNYTIIVIRIIDRLRRYDIILIACILISISIPIIRYDYFTIDQYFERDLIRALSKYPSFWIDSSEIFGGGKTPGYAYNLILFILSFLTNNNLQFIYVLYVLSYTYTAFFLVKSRFGSIWSEQSVVAILLLVTTYFAQELLSSLWNPTFAIPFIFLSLAYFFKNKSSKKTSYYILSITFALIAASCHLSNWILVLILLGFTLRRSSSTECIKKTFIFTILIVIFFGPFIINEINNYNANNKILVHKLNYDQLQPILHYFYHYIKLVKSFVGIPFFSSEVGFQWRHRAQFDNIYFQYTLIIISCCPVLLIFLNIKLKDIFSNIKQYNLFLLGSFLSILAFYFSKDNLFTNPRRFLWYYPIVVLSFADLMSRKVYQKKLLTISLFLFSSAQILYTLCNFYSVPSNETYHFKKNVLMFLKENYGYSYNDAIYRVNLITQDNVERSHKKYSLASAKGDLNSLFFTGSNSIFPQEVKADTLEKDCIFIITNTTKSDITANEIYTKYIKNDKILNNIISPLNIHEVKFSSKGNTYFKHPSYSNNCPIYFRSFYINPERQEVNHRNLLENKEHALIHKIIYSENKKYYMLSIESKNVTTPDYPLDYQNLYISFKDASSNNIFTYKLISKSLRNKYLFSLPWFIDITEIPQSSYKVSFENKKVGTVRILK